MLYNGILDLSRQASPPPRSAWFAQRLRDQIAEGLFLSEGRLREVRAQLVQELSNYRVQAGAGTAVLGMSGGVDSALTAALFKDAGWQVVGFTLPIHQQPEETERGIEACRAFGIRHQHLDLSSEYDALVAAMGAVDPDLSVSDHGPARTRRGNLRARLRMMTLYDQAHRLGGIVASTDNFSELGAGFWTLHSDVGDVVPLQGLTKSWEVPWLARELGVPEKIWRANPTDRLGVGSGDEAQIAATYLEWDIMLFALHKALSQDPGLRLAQLAQVLRVEGDARAQAVLCTVLGRLGTTWHKRVNLIRLNPSLSGRFGSLDQIDERLFRPEVLRQNRAEVGFSVETEAAAAALCRRLGDRRMRLVTAESCTGGLLAASLAKMPGSSETLEGSFVTYRASLKTAALGVSRATIAERTVYDPEVARQMACGALEAAPEAHVALAITGVAGPGPDQGKPPGYVCIAACLRGQSPVAREFSFAGDPPKVLSATLTAALSMGLAAIKAADDAG
ncbi:NAD(+) synthase [Salipiger marinus]|uniref:NAD(+) synthase n=1 Tax=Salipiger marinus TaxID=555512 RepID=UPI002CC3C6BE|nr:NAD(+) synthase [Salipiger manganoxidans]MEB3422108.1 NAD(+) synthase [Salipiger manganoxidans]